MEQLCAISYLARLESWVEEQNMGRAERKWAARLADLIEGWRFASGRRKWKGSYTPFMTLTPNH